MDTNCLGSFLKTLSQVQLEISPVFKQEFKAKGTTHCESREWEIIIRAERGYERWPLGLRKRLPVRAGGPGAPCWVQVPQGWGAQGTGL